VEKQIADNLPVLSANFHNAETLRPAISNSVESLDGTRVALIKSLSTHNRFYTLARPDSGICNAGVVEEIPHDLVLGIAYPCLEDGLNDFCVVRTAFETLDLFPDDQQTCAELREMIEDARRNLTRRLMELLERIIARKAHFLGTNLQQFKDWTLKIIEQGISRYDIDTAMKVNVFSSVALTEQAQGGLASPRYRYEFHNSETVERLSNLEGREFLVALFADVLDSVLEDENYVSRYAFDKHIFQQFIAMLFVAYSATDPVFYGTHKDDYGVSANKDMEKTPLYCAVSSELRQLSGLPIVKQITHAPLSQAIGSELSDLPPANDWEAIALAEIAGRENIEVNRLGAPLPSHMSRSQAATGEETLLAPIAAICAVAHQLQKREPNNELARLLLREASRLVQELKMMGVLSPLAYNPGAVEEAE
jgi:hypothetical protein